MSYHKEEQDIYYIPPNFLTSGRLFGGMIRVRNAIEACVLVLLTGLPIIRLPLSLTARIILLCLIPLPLGIFAVIGFDGDSLTEFALNWIKWLFNRRILCRSDTEPQQSDKPSVRQRSGNQAPHQPPEQLGIKLKQHPPKARKRGKRRQRKSSDKKKTAQDRKASPKKGRKAATTEGFIPVVDINHGIAHLSDDRYIKILEVEPINFLLRSVREQKNIISAFASWMKISPVKLQIKVLTKKADISKHLNAIERDMDRENDPKCRELQQDYYNLIKTIGSREAITRRFLIIFEYEPTYNNRKSDYAEIVSTLETAARTAKQYFQHCDNVVVTHEDENAFLLDVLYTIFNRETCERIPLDKRIRELQVKQVTSGESDLKITLPQVLAPESIDLRHGSYIVMDGVYHAYLMVPSSGHIGECR